MGYICGRCGRMFSAGFEVPYHNCEGTMPPTAPPAKPAEIVKPARKKRQPAPENESKADRFKRLAVYRTTAAIKRLRSIAALANKSQYEYTDEQVKKIQTAIADEVRNIGSRFAGVNPANNGFTL